MDRFIGDKTKQPTITPENLKSNMDRFIVLLTVSLLFWFCDLKSNMDRFIGKQRSIRYTIISI